MSGAGQHFAGGCLCGGLVFGGVAGKDTSHTIYAGNLATPAIWMIRR